MMNIIFTWALLLLMPLTLVLLNLKVFSQVAQVTSLILDSLGSEHFPSHYPVKMDLCYVGLKGASRHLSELIRASLRFHCSSFRV